VVKQAPGQNTSASEIPVFSKKLGTRAWSITENMSPELIEKINVTFYELQNVLRQSKEFVIAYSGGKDSTLLVHLTVAALYSLRKRPKVHIVSVDTQVEIPTVQEQTAFFLKSIKKWVKQRKLPVKIHVLHPLPQETYWATLIGRGYVPPNRMFRWCVSRLKSDPVRHMVQALGEETIVLMGMRNTESAERRRSLNKRGIEGRWTRFTGANNIKVFLPIVDWTTAEVWEFLLKACPPWGKGYGDLYFLYFDSFDECTWKPNGGFSCSGNRFGCWTCTVVKKDTAMERLSERNPAMTELLNFKLWLQDMASRDEKRCAYSRKGKPSKGPFTLSARKEIYDSLKALGKRLNMEFLRDDEEKEIKRIWRKDKRRGFFDIPFTTLVEGTIYE